MKIRFYLPIIILFVAIYLFGMPSKALAFTCNWTNSGGNNLWSNSSNWSSCNSTTPQSSDTAVFDSANSSANATVDTSPTITALTIQGAYSGTITINTSQTLTVTGTTTFSSTNASNAVSASGTGSLVLQGNLSTSNQGTSGTIPITVSGSGSPTFTTSGTHFPSGTVTLNKSSGTITLAANWSPNSSGQNFTVASSSNQTLSGGFTLTLDTLNVNGSLEVTNSTVSFKTGTIANAGNWTSTGNETVQVGSGGLSNSGFFTMNGGTATCAESDTAILKTDVATTQRSISGYGIYRIIDTAIRDISASPTITVNSSTSTSNNAGINFSNETCNTVKTWAGTTSSWNTAGNWSPSGIPASNDLVVFNKTSSQNVTTPTGGVTVDGIEIHSNYGGTVSQGSGGSDTITIGDVSTGTVVVGWMQNGGTFTGVSASISFADDGAGDSISFYLKGGTFTSTSGTLTLRTVGSDNYWSSDGGTFLANNGTVDMGENDNGHPVTIDNSSGTITFNNLTFTTGNNPKTVVVTSGSNVKVTGTLNMDAASFGDTTYNGPGTIEADGNITTTDVGGGHVITGNITITLAGSASQTITDAQVGWPTGTFTLNKSGGTITLAANWNLTNSGQDLVVQSGSSQTLAGAFTLTVDDQVTISGTLTQTNANIATNSTTGTFTVSSVGTWTNYSTGDITIGSGGIVNSGTLILDGTAQGCGNADAIAIRSSQTNTQRSWLGSGGFVLYDVDMKDQNTSLALVAISSTNSGNNSGFTFFFKLSKWTASLLEV
jgi:hypothetical protein